MGGTFINRNVDATICRRCGRPGDAKAFALDPIFKQVVCPQCVKERKKPGSTLTAEKPTDWDYEDEVLEKTHKLKQQQKPKETIRYVRINDEKIKIICPKCEFPFVYNTVRDSPRFCPFCARRAKPS